MDSTLFVKNDYIIRIYKITDIEMIEYMSLSSKCCGQLQVLGD